ncbi:MULTISPECIES: nucleotidyl transferase AbiEii/AbiGii toxin family protein [Lacticaseibacillus]|uniref:nucleotidyl transferase AbiEii/AbiGii toxin family protein n=1 Tax=Lacticaseibacillus TaxID=2759736 RepID=UPI00063D8FE3|nr:MULTISPECIES: nucleotidyl transferase AbiEii/AbiGii toxin family protein [Lacticaseibacillus]KLI75412.1 abortive infection protein [Lacticaseibacillus casei]
MKPYEELSPHKIANRINKAADALGVQRENMQLLFRLQELLRQIGESRYKDDFIFKGGFELTTFLGAPLRTTTDLDATLNNHDLTPDNLKEVLTEIFDHAQSPIHFTVTRVKPEMNANHYPGFRVGVIGTMGKTSSKLNIDISTGDTIYPEPIQFSHTNFIDPDDKIMVKAFPLEQVMADKLLTIYQKGSRNTRAKDFYDIWVLSVMGSVNLDQLKLTSAFKETAKTKQITDLTLDNGEAIIEALRMEPNMTRSWQSYQTLMEFAHEIELNQVLNKARDQLRTIFKTFKNTVSE